MHVLQDCECWEKTIGKELHVGDSMLHRRSSGVVEDIQLDTERRTREMSEADECTRHSDLKIWRGNDVRYHASCIMTGNVL